MSLWASREKRTWCVRTHKRRKMRERAAKRKGTRIKLRSLSEHEIAFSATRQRERERERERERMSRAPLTSTFTILRSLDWSLEFNAVFVAEAARAMTIFHGAVQIRLHILGPHLAKSDRLITSFDYQARRSDLTSTRDINQAGNATLSSGILVSRMMTTMMMMIGK